MKIGIQTNMKVLYIIRTNAYISLMRPVVGHLFLFFSVFMKPKFGLKKQCSSQIDFRCFSVMCGQMCCYCINPTGKFEMCHSYARQARYLHPISSR